MSTAEHVKAWRRRTKEKLVEAMGGKCVTCGYNNCFNALEFHHLDPTQKDFSFGKIRANAKSWESIVVEVKKCVLLCANCHREVHAGILNVPSNVPIFLKEIEDYKLLEKEKIKSKNKKKCLHCKKMFYSYTNTNRFCSVSCYNKSRYKINWNEIDLKELWPKNSILSIAKMLGVSDNAVKKHLIKQGLKKL